MRALFSLLIIAIYSVGGLSAQSDSISITLCAEHPYSSTYSAYSGCFNVNAPAYLYVCSNELGLVIFEQGFDCTMSAIDTLSNAVFDNHRVTNVYQQNDLLFVSLGNFQSIFNSPVGLAILDLSDPASPNLISMWDTTAYVNGSAIVQVQDNYAYLGMMDDGLLILNIEDPADIQFVSRLELDPDFPGTPGLFDVPHARGLVVRDNYAYIAHDAGGLRIVDISDKEHPVEIGKYINEFIEENALSAYNNLVLSGNLAFIAIDYCGIEVVDISNPALPAPVSIYNLWGCDGANWEGRPGHANELVIPEGESILFVSSGDSEVVAIDISDPEDLQVAGTYGAVEDSSAAWGLAMHADQLALFYVNNSTVPNWIPQPFYSDYGGVRLLNWTKLQSNKVSTSIPLDKSITPNPFHARLQINLDSWGSGIKNVQLFDALGRLVLAQKFDGLNLELDTKRLPPGVYFLHCSSQKQRGVGKVIKE